MIGTRRTTRRAARVGAVALAGALALSGCDFDVYHLPLPGGTDVGSDPMTVTAEFSDVLDLVPQSTVKVSDVSVGKITDVDLDGYTAVVTMELRNDVDLPEDTVAAIRQTSLLGEKFVSLSAPAGGGSAERLADGDRIDLDRTGRNPEVEEVLGALSMVLAGGGVAQLKTITTELGKALEGREDSARSVLTQIADLMGELDDNKDDIVDAIESLNRLAVSVRQQQDSIDAALEELPSALRSLDSQREDLVNMLTALDRLGQVGVRVIKRSKVATIQSFRQLQPVLTQLADSGDDLVNAFNVFLTFPFVDEVVGRDPQVARNLQMGDYTNLSVQLDVDLANLPDVPGLPCFELDAIPDALPIDLTRLCTDAQDALADCLNTPSTRTCAALPGGLVRSVCNSLPTKIPILCGGGRKTGASGNARGNGKDTKGWGLLGGIADLLGGGLLGRAPVASSSQMAADARVESLKQTYDPALVSLLAPGALR
ncbi:MCE family protein [Nocardioides sp. R-C-SC26]|uniref:MCE family protein n=1 Tax=Nocardioides sp. R-C-SC26 TaxID=2870414 RepID=UPI001E506484|nr:MCE family protein [Nocardioides sp. R-C-SC26]